ncbi:aminodeoxychorismate lyase [Hydrogenovibrio kuenenii]|uniref:aminodeoxychorismate lyase n=1 Tax=Hydrogenovibrio kuenenii TaxID=63658 RepID=UPI0004634C21|nr:aminodeoxychorismate lyase [Hydrogenovibrio kuenenii]
MTTWYNGQPLQDDQLSFNHGLLDRGLQYGDGFFTTILLLDGGLVNWSAHLKRIQQSAERLKFQDLNLTKLIEDFSCFVESLVDSDEVVPERMALKILVTRGFGGKGYQPPEKGQGSTNWIFQAMPYPSVGGVAFEALIESKDTFSFDDEHPAWQIFPQKLTVSDVCYGQQPLLAGLKHLNRLENVLARQALMESSFDEAVMCSLSGECVSATQSNLLWICENTVYTPELTSCGVSGTTLPVILDLAKSQGYQVQVDRFHLNVLNQADEILLCNALRGVMPVTKFINKTLERQFSTEKTLQLAYDWMKWAAENRTHYQELFTPSKTL